MPTFGNFTFTTTGRQVLNFAQLYMQQAGLNFLLVSDAGVTADDMAALILTKCERTILLNHPALNATQTTVTVAANARDIDVSTSLPLMYGARIDRLFYHLEDDPLDMTPIRMVDRTEGENRIGLSTEDYTQKVPDWAYFDRDRATVRLQYKVPVSTTFIVAYRSAGTTYVGEDLDTDLSCIPDQHMETLYYLVAAEFCGLISKKDRKAELLEMFREADSILTESLAETVTDITSAQFDQIGFKQPLVRQNDSFPNYAFT